MKTMKKEQAHELAVKIAKVLDDKKGRDIVIIDISAKSVLADYFVIASGRSTTAVKSLCDNVEEKLSEEGIEPARRDGNVIIHVANGITHIGPARQQDGDYSYLADILQTVLPDVAWHNNIRAELWRKLAVNCVINPLTAIWNCPNGELRHHPQEIMQICEEVAAVIEREGHHTSAEDLRDYVMQVIDATAENISSMLQDIRALRHTEIDYINGFLLRRARAHGIAVPENTRLFEMVKRKESEYERIGTGLPRPW